MVPIEEILILIIKMANNKLPIVNERTVFNKFDCIYWSDCRSVRKWILSLLLNIFPSRYLYLIFKKKYSSKNKENESRDLRFAPICNIANWKPFHNSLFSQLKIPYFSTYNSSFSQLTIPYFHNSQFLIFSIHNSSFSQLKIPYFLNSHFLIFSTYNSLFSQITIPYFLNSKFHIFQFLIFSTT